MLRNAFMLHVVLDVCAMISPLSPYFLPPFHLLTMSELVPVRAGSRCWFGILLYQSSLTMLSGGKEGRK